MSNQSFTRRAFLKGNLALLGLSALNIESVFSAGKEPVKFEKSRVRLGMAAYSFVNEFRNDEINMKEFIDYCYNLGLDGVELTSYFFESESDSYLLELRNKCFHMGMDITGTAIGNDFITPDKQERQKQVEDVKKWIDKAVVLGAPSIRVFGGGDIPDDYTENDAYDWVISSMQECVDYAAQKGIVLAMANHGGFPVTSEQVIKIIQEIDSPWFGALLDTGNFLKDWYRQIAEVLPYAVMMHLKVNMHSTVEGAKPIPADMERIFRLIENQGYERYVDIEYEEDAPYEDIPPLVKRLRKLM